MEVVAAGDVLQNINVAFSFVPDPIPTGGNLPRTSLAVAPSGVLFSQSVPASHIMHTHTRTHGQYICVFRTHGHHAHGHHTTRRVGQEKVNERVRVAMPVQRLWKWRYRRCKFKQMQSR